MERQTVKLEASEGLALTADVYGPETGPPAILLHGGGQTRHAWAGTATRLGEAGFRALSFDQRGHGDSEWHPEGDYHFEAFSRDVAALAAHFDRPPVLIGASLGGIASLLAVAEQEGMRASALVLVDIATRMQRDGVDRIMSFMRARPDGFESLEDAADAIAEYMPHRPRPKDLSGLQKNLRQREDGRYRWHWDPLFVEGSRRPGHEFDLDRLDRAAARLELPTLLVRGRMSDILSEEGAQQFLSQVPHARFADVSGAGHMVAGDRNDVFTDAVLSFLKEEVPAE